MAAREAHSPIIVPHVVAGEAFTKLRYDKRVSPRRDARVALAVFGMVEENPEAFAGAPTPAPAYARAREILRQYADHTYSFIDAVIFHIVEAERSIDRVLTVDGEDFRSFRFSHSVEIVTPA